MAFERLSYAKDWTRAEDFPTYESNEVQVRADMQYHPNAVRDFLNALLTALEGKNAAATIGASDETGAAATMQSVLDTHAQTMAQLRDDLDTLSGGGVPLSVQSTQVVFYESSWVSVAGGVRLIIAKSDHKRERSAFGCNIYYNDDGVYRSGTWCAAATLVTYNDDGTITLSADRAYAGKIVFFGL